MIEHGLSPTYAIAEKCVEAWGGSGLGGRTVEDLYRACLSIRCRSWRMDKLDKQLKWIGRLEQMGRVEEVKEQMCSALDEEKRKKVAMDCFPSFNEYEECAISTNSRMGLTSDWK